MDLKLSKNPSKIKLNWNQFRAKTEVECVELHSESVGNQWGTHLELFWNWLANLMFSFGECMGNAAQGLLGNEWGIDQGLLRDFYELFGKQLIFVGAAGKCIGNSSGILTNYLGNRWYS